MPRSAHCGAAPFAEGGAVVEAVVVAAAEDAGVAVVATGFVVAAAVVAVAVAGAVADLVFAGTGVMVVEVASACVVVAGVVVVGAVAGAVVVAGDVVLAGIGGCVVDSCGSGVSFAGLSRAMRCGRLVVAAAAQAARAVSRAPRSCTVWAKGSSMAVEAASGHSRFSATGSAAGRDLASSGRARHIGSQSRVVSVTTMVLAA